MKLRRGGSLERKRSKYAYIFLIPWLIGILQFFLVPVIKAFIYSVSSVSMTADGFVAEFSGLANYNYSLNEDPNYLDNLLASVSSYLYSIPIIIAVSLMIAILLNKKFKGRAFFRALYFLPVVFASGIVMQFLNGDINATLTQIEDAGAGYTVNAIDFTEILDKLNFPTSITEVISKYIAEVFNLVWSCGVPITLFISGLQTIPPQLYEASTVEGANKWEEFWYISFPMLADVLVLVIIYVSLDLFTMETNPIINQAYTFMREQSVYDYSAAMLWLYFLIATVITGGVILLFNRLCMRRWR